MAKGKARPLREALAAARSLEALETLEGHLEHEVLSPLRAVADGLEGRRETARQARRREAEERRRAAAQRETAHVAAVAARRAATARRAALQTLYRRTTTRPGEDVREALLAVGCLVPRRESYQEEAWGSRVRRGVYALSTWASPPSQPEPPDPWDHPRPPLVAHPAAPAPRYVTKTRRWYEDGRGRRQEAGALVA